MLDESARWLYFVHWNLMNLKCGYHLLCVACALKELPILACKSHSLTHSLTGCKRWIFTHGSGAIGTVVLGSHFLSLCWTWKAAAHAHAHTHTHSLEHTHTHNSRPSQSYGPQGTWETTTAKHQHSKHHCTKIFSLATQFYKWWETCMWNSQVKTFNVYTCLPEKGF